MYIDMANSFAETSQRWTMAKDYSSAGGKCNQFPEAVLRALCFDLGALPEDHDGTSGKIPYKNGGQRTKDKSGKPLAMPGGMWCNVRQ